jgi:uncharacterized SAM-binding protein YcdF (DUF218 family)
MTLLRAITATILVGIFGWGLVLLSIFLFGGIDEAREADVIVVLGAAQYDGRPSPVLKARLDHALELYEQGISSRMIMTGGVGVGDTVSEAEVGRRYAIRAGVDAENILVERSGLNSEQSMVAVSRLMERHGLETAVLVSDPFHMLRLRLLAAALGVRAYSSPTPSSPIERGSIDEWRHVARESVIIPSLVVGRLFRGVRGAETGVN